MSLDDITNAFAEHMEPSDNGDPMLMTYDDFAAALTSLNIPSDLFRQLYAECTVADAPVGFEDFVSTISSAKTIIEEYEEPSLALGAVNQDVSEAFKALANSEGVIDFESLSRVNAKLQLKTSASDLKAMLKMNDPDNNATIGFEAFCKLYERASKLSIK